jgi:signal transduction histidine kinase
VATADPTRGIGVRSRGAWSPFSPHRALWAPKPAVLAAVACAGLAVAGATVVLGLRNDEIDHVTIRIFEHDWLIVNYVGAGLIAWWRRPGSRFGPLMVAAGFVNFLGGALGWASADVPVTIGLVLALLPPMFFLYVFLAYPTGRLAGRVERAIVVGAFVTAIGLGLARVMLGDGMPGGAGRNLIEVVSAPGAVAAVLDVQLMALSGFCLAGIGVLALRRWGPGRSPRRPLGPLVDSFALGLVMIAVLFGSHVVAGAQVRPVEYAAFFVVGLAPIAFLTGLLQSRLTVGPAIVALGAQAARGGVAEALKRALRDPSLEVAYWVPEYQRYADRDGRAIELPRSAGRATTLIDREDGTHVAALVHDVSLREEPALLEAVTAAGGFALENERLHAELHARVEELRGSRARIFEVAQAERQRLERDLHDGAQQRLVALSLELGLLGQRFAGDPDAKAALEQTRREVTESLRELRELARGIHPAVVTGHGLAVALKTLAARAQVPVRLTVALDGRLPERQEVAAYYVVAESLTNVAKHACASSAAVEVRHAGGRLVVEVVDDGAGGADTRGGSGLRGLADRVEALGGRLRVWSPAGGGTRVEAEIPCA